MQQPRPQPQTLTGKQITLLIFGWIAVSILPTLGIFIAIFWTWAPGWAGVMKLTGFVLIGGGLVLLFLLMRRWIRRRSTTGNLIAAVFVGLLLVLDNGLSMFGLFRHEQPYEDVAAKYEFDLPAGKHAFYVAHAHSLGFFFDGGYSVWVHEDGSPFVEQAGKTIWKNEYRPEPEIEGNRVHFYFIDDNFFSRGTGKHIVYDAETGESETD